MLRKIIGYFFSFLLFLLSYIIPKKRNLILFSSSHGKAFRGNPKYLYLHFLQNQQKNSFQILWITENKELVKELKGNKLPCIYKYSFNGFYTILRSLYIIVESSRSVDFNYSDLIIGNFHLIQTWHGTPLKKLGIGHHVARYEKNSFSTKIVTKLIVNEFKKYTFMLSPSNEVSQKLNLAFSNQNIFVTGYPRNDIFFKEKLIYEDLKEKLDLFKYTKIVCYIPTWRDVKTNTKSFDTKGLKVLNQYLKGQNSLFIFKKHPLEENIPDLSGFSNIKDYSEQIDDVQELLVHTDLLITDYSSVFFDFCLTNKPIIYYPYDYKEYLEDCRDMYYDYYEELTGPFAKNQEELLELIKTTEIWFKDKEYQKKYNRFKKKFNKYTDGRSCERVFKILEKKV